ncbi:MAG: metallophosphoesterase [Planctomycetes bacterium]|nr:metallophosphoesterase [Planctomycetota bacterium]
MTDVRKPPRRFSDEALVVFRTLRFLGSRVWPGKRAYRAWLARGGLRAVHVDVPVPGLHEDLDGLRIVQLSDPHGGCFVDEASLEPAVDLARALRPDVLAITGDFVTRRMEDARELGSAFGRIPAPLGRFAVFGNHDYRHRREGEIAAWLRRQGVVTLRNASVLVRRGAGRLRVVGLEDLEEAKVADMDLALAEARADDHATLLLCHHPDVYDVVEPGRFDLVLTGHSHGGQIVLPLVGSLGRAWMPKRLSGTHELPGGGRLHVNRGLGVLVVPLRVGAPAEVTCCVLRRMGDDPRRSADA